MPIRQRVAKLNKAIGHLKFVRNLNIPIRIFRGYFFTLALRRDTLRSIELAVTYRCQASCHKCYSANLEDAKRSYLTVAQIGDIINQALKLGIIHVNITGGEPTLRRDITEVIRACRPDALIVSLVTNAISLNRQMLKAFKEAGLNTIQLSLDSAEGMVHDALRGVSGSYDKVIAAARWARELGINVCFSTVLSTESSSDKVKMVQLLDLAKREKAYLLICDSAAVGGWQGIPEKMMTCTERNNALRELMQHPSARHHNMYNFRGHCGCPAGVEKVYITAYGDVTPCDLIHDSFGNVLNESLKEICLRMRTHPLYSRKLSDCPRYMEDFKSLSGRSRTQAD